MIVLKFICLFLSILSLVLFLEQMYLIHLVVKSKGTLRDSGTWRLILLVVFSLSTAATILIW